jgi:hypothetical protein
VTTLVSEINAIKHVNGRNASSDSPPSRNFIEISESFNKSSSLIEVSDDENGSDDEDDDGEGEDDDDSDDDMDDSSTSDDESSKSSVASKTFNKVVVNNPPEIPLGNYTSGIVVLKLDEPPVDVPEVPSLHTTEEPQVVEIDSNTTDQVKNITLDDETQFHLEVDYKKMPVNKLRAFILEKNISSGDVDISKMKKPDLIKLIEQVEVIEESE